MESLVWRPRAKVIAILEIIYLTLEILAVVLIGLLFAGVFAVAASNPDGSIKDKDVATAKAAVWVIIVVCILAGLVIAIEMFAAVKLLHAAQLGKDTRVAVRNARIWRNITIVCGILSLIGYGVTLSIIPFIITIVWRGIGLFIVIKFINELDKVISSRSSGDPTGPLGVMIQQ